MAGIKEAGDGCWIISSLRLEQQQTIPNNQNEVLRGELKIKKLKQIKNYFQN
jgi:hypothetical protein